MTAKEKAQELLIKFYKLAEGIEWTDRETMQKAESLNDELGEDVEYYWHELAKQSALMAVDEISTQFGKITVSHKISAYVSHSEFEENLTSIQNQLDSNMLSKYYYWTEVKQELEQL